MPNMDPKKCPMPSQDPNVRNKNFKEVALGYTAEMAVNEAKRCLQCKKPACRTGCPVQIDIPAFIAEVAKGDFEAAYQVIAKSSALPAVCGRVCPQENQCEGKCVRGIKGEPVGIGRLERFVADWHRENVHTPAAKPEPNGHKVAVIGAGPSGLTVAGDLAKLGYKVTVYEALHVAGGVLMYGIPEFRLPKDIVQHEVEGLKELGVDAVYFGPVFESVEHGYDTTDYRVIDRRLGTNEMFAHICDELHKNGIRVILDGVFNHVGRNFWAFKDVQEKGQASEYCDWFAGLNFGGQSPCGDNFWYEGWNGYYNLVKLNLRNWHVCDYLIDAVGMWMDQFHIDGIRFDAADCVDFDFFRRIHNFCKERNPEFWLMGEIIHGDYKRWANPEMLDSVTNYECYKGIYSSHNDKNYFEINYSINRQFGNGGIYQGVALYNFVDNHDVNRLASTLCYTLMYCMPGIPSVYYGSEYGVMGRHENNSDDGLRPCLDLDDLNRSGNLDLYRHLVKLGRIYHAYPALRTGSYYTVEVRNRQLLFAKEQDGRTVYVALNLEDCPSEFRFGTHVPSLVDVISGQPVQVENGGAWIRMAPFSSMILVEDDIVNQTEPEAAAVAVPEPTVLEAGAKYRDVLDGSVCELLQTSVRHAETQEELVVYRKEQDGSVWAMPKSIFTGTAHDNQPRFEKL